MGVPGATVSGVKIPPRHSVIRSLATATMSSSVAALLLTAGLYLSIGFTPAWDLAIGGEAHASEDPGADRVQEKPVVVKVTGNEVNVRSGPSIDYHRVGTASTGDLLVRVGADGEFLRVRVPGGPIVYVFEALIEWEEGALRGTVAADDVLMRATPDQAYYPVHDQKLRRGDPVVVLGVETGEDGRWYRVVAPERIHVWMHGRYAEPTRIAPDSAQVREAAHARLDALTDGRTKGERERVESARRAKVVARLDALDAALASGASTSEQATEAGGLASDETAEDLKRRAAELHSALAKSVADRQAQAERERIARMKTDAEEAQQEQRLREEAHRRRMEEIERRKKRADRGAPNAVGIVRVRGSRTWLETSKAVLIDLRSLRFHLADYAGRSVRIWGARQKHEGGRDRIEVSSIEIVGD